MRKNVNAVNNLLFEIGSDLEKYRVETLLTKEAETIAWIDNWTNRDQSPKVFYDVGANIGIYSLYAASKDNRTEVYAFEPVSCNYAALLKNISLNPSANVNAFKAALSKKIGIDNLYLSDDRVGNSGAQIESPINERGEKYMPLLTEKTLCFSLNSLVNKFYLPVPNYVKIDVDGREGDILTGMSDILRNCKLKSLLVEFNDLETYEKWRKLLSEHNFMEDQRFENISNHSNTRRASKKNSPRNYIFSRIES
jgi:FkbM family methyltransferase